MSQPSNTKRGPVDVKARIQKFQQQEQCQANNANSEFPKSSSFNDLRSMTLIGEDGWVIAESNSNTKRENSPQPPPKPMARKKKFIPSNVDTSPSSSPQLAIKNSMKIEKGATLNKEPESFTSSTQIHNEPSSSSTSHKLGSTDLFLLPKSKAVPPRPPPTYLKPNRRGSPPETVKEEETPIPSTDNKPKPTPTVETTNTDAIVPTDQIRDRKSSGADTNKSSGTEETSSLSDSVEEEKPPKVQGMVGFSLCMLLQLSSCVETSTNTT